MSIHHERNPKLLITLYRVPVSVRNIPFLEGDPNAEEAGPRWDGQNPPVL